MPRPPRARHRNRAGSAKELSRETVLGTRALRRKPGPPERASLAVIRAPCPPDNDGLAGRREELQRNVVGVAEGKPRPVRCVDDAPVNNSELVELRLPRLQLRAVGTSEREVVQSNPTLIERASCGIRELVEADKRAADRPYDVTERSGVLVQYRLRSEQLLVPRNTAVQIADGKSDVGDRRKVGHGVLQRISLSNLRARVVRVEWLGDHVSRHVGIRG